MHQRMKITSVFLIVLLFIEIPTPSLGFGMLQGGGGGGGSSVAEILAAGLITKLLMSNNPRSMPMLRAMTKPFMGGYSTMQPRHVMYPMMTARYPMMGSFIFPTMHRPHYMMNHAMMAQAAKDHAMMAQAAKDHAMMAQAAKDHAMMAQAAKDHAMRAQAEKDHAMMAQAVEDRQVLASRLNEEIKALEAQESMLEAALERTRQGAATAITELLNEEETAIPAAALLLETADLVDPTPVLPNPPILPPPEMYQVAPSEPESRYILPRIVRHFVQRLLRRGENN